MTIDIEDGRKRRAIDFLMANEARLPNMRVVSHHKGPFRGVTVEVDDDDVEDVTDALERDDFYFEVSD